MRRQTEQGKRRELAWFLAGFVACQLGLAVAVDRFWPAVRDPEFARSFAALRHHRAAEPRRPLVVLLGSSRTLSNVRDDLFRTDPSAPLVYNLGVGGGGPMMELVCLRRLLRAGVKPNYLFLEVVPVYLNQDGGPLEEGWLDPARLSTAELARLWPYYTRLDRLFRWAYARLLPVYRHQAELRRQLGLGLLSPVEEAGVTPDGYGWHPYPEGDAAARRRNTRATLGEFERVLHRFVLASRQARVLRDLLAECRRAGIPAALVLMPEASDLRAVWPPEMRAGIDAFVQGLCRETGVPLIETRAWMRDADFWDGHHLSAPAAARFTERFDREVIRPLLHGTAASGTCQRPEEKGSGR
jgi:hypothetical protein